MVWLGGGEPVINQRLAWGACNPPPPKHPSWTLPPNRLFRTPPPPQGASSQQLVRGL